MCINITIKVTDFIFLTRQATFSHLLKVRRRSPRELGDWHVGLAIAMGDCDWLLLLHLWGGAAKFDRSSSSPAGHCQGRYRACPSGQSLYLFTLIMPPSSLRILHTGCNKRSKQTKKKNSGVNMFLCCSHRSLATGRPTENPHGLSCWQPVSARAASSLLRLMQWLPSSPCENWHKL